HHDTLPHLTSGEEAALGHPLRSQPALVIRAPVEVRVVVREVRPDLDQERREQRRGEDEWPCGASLADAGGSADEHWHGCRGKSRGTRSDHPRACTLTSTLAGHAGTAGLGRAGGAHGKRGNFEKSGGRFSRKAFLPSFASSVR